MIVVAICFLLHCSNGQFATTPMYGNNSAVVGNNGTVLVGNGTNDFDIVQLKIGLMFANKTSRYFCDRNLGNFLFTGTQEIIGRHRREKSRVSR
jgi:hypothetical protein